jgi:hypothetical protein
VNNDAPHIFNAIALVHLDAASGYHLRRHASRPYRLCPNFQRVAVNDVFVKPTPPGSVSLRS